MCAKFLVFFDTSYKEILLNFYLRTNIKRLLFTAYNIDQVYDAPAQLTIGDTIGAVRVVLLTNK